MGRRSNIDWERIERDYRIGSLTIGEISEKHGVAYSSITLKAKQKGWERDLTESVAAATKAALIADSKARAAQLGADIGREIGEKSAQGLENQLTAQVTENVVMVRRHLKASIESQELVNALKARLHAQVEGGELTVAQAAQALKMLVETETKNKDTQREALNIGGDADRGASSIDALLSKIGASVE